MIPRITLPQLCLVLLACSTPVALAFQGATTTQSTGRQTTISHVSSFQDMEDPRTFTRRPLRQDRIRNNNNNNNNVANKQNQKSDPSALAFSGQISKSSSQPLASSGNEADRERLIDFFKSTEARNTLFVSDATPVPIHPVSPQLFRSWQAETQRLGATLPQRSESDQQTVMQLCSNGISFSGLTVETIVFCGAKLIESCPDNNGLPVYEFTMIQDKTTARGPKFLMVIYNQVMGLVGSRSSSSSSSSEKTTTSLCRISLKDNNGDGLGIHFESNFQVKVKLPSFLLKVLPVSKDRAEKQGSSAVMGFVEKGVVDSLQRFEQTFRQQPSQVVSSANKQA